MISKHDFYMPEALGDFPRESPENIDQYLERLFPIMRSLTGNGVRRTHDILAELLPLQRTEIPSGTPCFDWNIPKEWNAIEAYVVDPNGQRILDIQNHNLHLVNYSIPFRGMMSRSELDSHLHSLPEQPDAIPYVTSYYVPRWGFCLPHRQREKLPEGQYQVVVDTTLEPGSLTLSDAVLPGRESREILISTYTCHPSMANNELSGPLVAAFLYRRLAAVSDRRYTYRFVFAPETIGSIAYLSKHGSHMISQLEAGFVTSCVGDRAPFTYKRSRRGDTLGDRAACYSLQNYCGVAPRLIDFAPRGSDERQYCSPGFNLPVGVIARSIYGSYSEYHTSLDDLNFVSADSISSAVDACFSICLMLERNRIYRRTSPFCEPQLGKRGMYPTFGARPKDEYVNALMWLLNFADGDRDLLAIAEHADVDFWLLEQVAQACVREKLLTV